MTDRLRALFVDHLSIPRGKYLPGSKIGDNDTRFARATFGVHYDRDLLLDAPHAMVREGMPDMELRWRGDDIRQSWEPGTQIVVGDLYDTEGAALPLCPRGALKRAIADWGRHGLTPKVGIELEAYALQGDEQGRLRPYDTPGGVVYGTGPFADPMRFNDVIWRKAEEMGFHLDMITAEYDSPQFEYTLTFDDALKAVDDIVLFRLMAREIALDHGIILTFLPKPIAETGGSGMHINFSFVDETGANALSTGPQGAGSPERAVARVSRRVGPPPQGAGGAARPYRDILSAAATGVPVGLLAELGRRPQGRHDACVLRGRGQGPAGAPHGRRQRQSVYRHRRRVAGRAAGL